MYAVHCSWDRVDRVRVSSSSSGSKSEKRASFIFSCDMGLIVWYTLNLISINSLCTSRRFVEMMEEVATVICTLTYHKYANDVNEWWWKKQIFIAVYTLIKYVLLYLLSTYYRVSGQVEIFVGDVDHGCIPWRNFMAESKPLISKRIKRQN